MWLPSVEFVLFSCFPADVCVLCHAVHRYMSSGPVDVPWAWIIAALSHLMGAWYFADFDFAGPSQFNLSCQPYLICNRDWLRTQVGAGCTERSCLGVQCELNVWPIHRSSRLFGSVAQRRWHWVAPSMQTHHPRPMSWQRLIRGCIKFPCKKRG